MRELLPQGWRFFGRLRRASFLHAFLLFCASLFSCFLALNMLTVCRGPYVVCRIVVILRISWYWAYWWYCRMDLTWYSRSDVMTDVVTELGSLHRHVRDRLGRAVGRVSRSRLSTSSRPLLPSTILLSATESTCSSMAWGSTVFGVAGLVNSFEARKVVLWLLETCQQSRTGWCCVVSTRLNPRRLAKPPRVSPLHV